MRKKKMGEDNFILAYYQKIKDGSITVGRWIELLYEYLVTGLDKKLFFFDQKKANAAVDWFETHCFHVEGALAPGRIRLELWQKAMLSAIFGIVDESGGRQFREVLLVVARKNGKSIIASGIGNYIFRVDGGYGAKVFCCAPKLEQADIVYSNLWQMITLDPEWQAMKELQNERDEHNKKIHDDSMMPKKRQSDCEVAFVAVIEGEHDHFFGKFAAIVKLTGSQLARENGGVAVFRQPLEVLLECVGAHHPVGLDLAAFDEVMVHQHRQFRTKLGEVDFLQKYKYKHQHNADDQKALCFFVHSNLLCGSRVCKKIKIPPAMGRNLFRGTTQIRAKTRALKSDNGGKPSAHFLAAAPGRTSDVPTVWLSAADQTSLLRTLPLYFPFNAFNKKYLYHKKKGLARGISAFICIV
jgi:hypothetical protein